jgi:hypothetical protein
MAITTTQLGPNSYKLNVSIGTDHLQTLNALISCITAGHGWEVVDNTFPYYVFRSLNADTTSYKYARILLQQMSWRNTTDWVASIVPYESWNASTHVGTNACYRADSIADAASAKISFQIRSSETNLTIYVFVNPRWLMLGTKLDYNGAVGQVYASMRTYHHDVVGQSMLSVYWGHEYSSFQGFSGCFEYRPFNLYGTTFNGFPRHIWTHTAYFYDMATPCYELEDHSNVNIGYLPRWRASSGTSSVTRNSSPVYLLSAFEDVVRLRNDTNSTPVVNPFASGLNLADIAISDSQRVPLGKLYGLKLMPGYGLALGTVLNVRTDADYSCSLTGGTTEHFALKSVIARTAYNSYRGDSVLNAQNINFLIPM